MRQSLDKMGPSRGQRLRIYFPHDQPIRTMVATGEVRESSSDRYEHDHLMRNEAGTGEEWVPGWYVAQAVAPGDVV